MNLGVQRYVFLIMLINSTANKVSRNNVYQHSECLAKTKIYHTKNYIFFLGAPARRLAVGHVGGKSVYLIFQCFFGLGKNLYTKYSLHFFDVYLQDNFNTKVIQ
jgi:hypothetical protein